MGSKSKKPKQQVSEYRLSLHLGLCHGPIDELGRIFIGEKLAASGGSTPGEILTVDRPDLFGGIKKEGGVAGLIRYLPGGGGQTIPGNMASKFGRAASEMPGFRGLASLFFYGFGGAGGRPGFYWTANSPFLRAIWAEVTRKPVGLSASIALIPRQSPPAGTALEVSWFQNTFVQSGGNDEARMGAAFLDAAGAQIGATVWAPYTQPVGWTARTLEVGLPAGTAILRVYMGMRRLAGTHNDGYIDSIGVTLDGAELALTNPGAESGTASWTNETGSIDTTNDSLGAPGTPAPHAGAFMFAGGFNAETAAYQDIVLPGEDANPAHIIYECLTDGVFGLGLPPATIDTATFEAAAQVLFAEGLGLSLMWSRQTEIETFIREILDHINGMVFQDPASGLLTIKLIRDDYDPDDLVFLSPMNFRLDSFQRKGLGETVNEITVTYTDPDTEKDATVPAHDLGNISAQGQVVTDSRNFYGVRTARLATQLAFRELRVAASPLAAAEGEADRSAWALTPGQVVKLAWPEYSIDDLIMRIVNIDYGQPGQPAIKLSLVEDVFALPASAFEDPPESLHEDPADTPSPVDTAIAFTLPYFLAVNAAEVDVAALAYPDVLVGILAAESGEDTWQYDLLAEETDALGNTAYALAGRNAMLSRASLAAAVDPEEQTAGVFLLSPTQGTAPAVGSFLVLGEGAESANEICMVSAAAEDGELTLERALLDTVPRYWPSGTPVWTLDPNDAFTDDAPRVALTTQNYKILTVTSLGTLAESSAPVLAAGLTERPHLPTRPANVTVAGSKYQSVDVAGLDPIPVTWSRRNRLTEDSQVLNWEDADVTPEAGETYTVTLYDADGAEIVAFDGLTGTSYDLDPLDFGTGAAFGFVGVTSQRDGFDSLQGHRVPVIFTGGYGYNYGYNYGGFST